MLWVLKIEDW
jgi:hypothetical protein